MQCHKALRLEALISRYILGFPGVIGCIVGTHIPIVAPSINEVEYM